MRRLQFSLRDLALVTAGTAVSISTLSWVARERGIEHPLLFCALYSLPVVGGMGGILLGGFRAGVIGAVAGACVLTILLSIIQ